MLENLGVGLKQSKFQIIALLTTLALFLITNHFLRDSALGFVPTLFAILIVIEIIGFVGLEVNSGAKKHGWKHEIVDTAIALGIAVAIWFGLCFILNTNTPISGVVSCSMLPNLQRGDFVIVQGASPAAYSLQMTSVELSSLTDDATVYYSNKSETIVGSIFAYCTQHVGGEMCSAFISNPESVIEQKGAFIYKYERCELNYSNGDRKTEPCLKSVTFHEQEYLTNFSNDVLVYQPVSGDLFSLVGDIVHRAMFKIDITDVKGGNSTYYLTRGDNNPVLDLQIYEYSRSLGNHPVPDENLRGKVIFRVPYLGYFKLFISGYLQEDSQCKTQLGFSHVN